MADVVEALVPLVEIATEQVRILAPATKWTLGGPLYRVCSKDPRQDISGRQAHDSLTTPVYKKKRNTV